MAEKKQVRKVINLWGPPALYERGRASGFPVWDPYWYLLGLREGIYLCSVLWVWQLLFLRLGLKGSKIRLVPSLSAMACCFRQG